LRSYSFQRHYLIRLNPLNIFFHRGLFLFRPLNWFKDWKNDQVNVILWSNHNSININNKQNENIKKGQIIVTRPQSLLNWSTRTSEAEFKSEMKINLFLSKTVLSNFCPKQVNEWIGGPRASLSQLFIAFITWPNLTCWRIPLIPSFIT
jgi:hypothetical protein